MPQSSTEICIIATDNLIGSTFGKTSIGIIASWGYAVMVAMPLLITDHAQAIDSLLHSASAVLTACVLLDSLWKAIIYIRLAYSLVSQISISFNQAAIKW